MDGIILWKVSGGSSLWRGLWLSSFGHSGIFYKRSAGGNDIFGGGIGTSLAASKGEERAGGDELAPFANPYLSAVFDRGCQRRGLFCRDVPYREKRQTESFILGSHCFFWERLLAISSAFDRNGEERSGRIHPRNKKRGRTHGIDLSLRGGAHGGLDRLPPGGGYPAKHGGANTEIYMI